MIWLMEPNREQNRLRALCTMCETEKAFTLVVQKKRIDEGENVNLETFMMGTVSHLHLSCDSHQHGKQVRHCAVVQPARRDFGKHKELRSDFSGANLPCGDMRGVVQAQFAGIQSVV